MKLAIHVALTVLACAALGCGSSSNNGSSTSGSGGTTGSVAVNFSPTYELTQISTTHDPTNNTDNVTMVKVDLADYAIDCADFEDQAPPGLSNHTLHIELDEGQNSTAYLTAGAYPVVAGGQGSSSNYAYGIVLTNGGQYNSVAGGTVTASALSKDGISGSYSFTVSDGTGSGSYSVSGQLNPTLCP